MLKRLKAVRSEVRVRDSEILGQKIVNIFRELDLLKPQATIAMFRSLSYEIDLTFLESKLAATVELAFPVTQSTQPPKLHFYRVAPGNLNQFNRGAFGVEEPDAKFSGHQQIQLADLAVVLVPGLCFGPEGARLGHGKGFYDYFLKSIPNVLRIAVGYSFQWLPSLSKETWDQPWDLFVTPDFVKVHDRKEQPLNLRGLSNE